MSQDKNAVSFCQSYYIALGSNQPTTAGSSLHTLKSIPIVMREYSLECVQMSRLFETPAFPAGSGPNFVNAAAEVRGPSNPTEMLEILHQIEADFDRKRVKRWGPRTLDLDIIAAHTVIYPTLTVYQKWRNLELLQQAEMAPDSLILPHPRLQDRSFVLVPLADIAPDWEHPVSKMTVREMLEARPESERLHVKPI